MTTKVAKKAEKANFPPLEKYLKVVEDKSITIFSALFQKHDPYQIYQTLNLFESEIPIIEGGETVQNIVFTVYSLKRDLLDIYINVKGLDMPVLKSLEHGVGDLIDALEALSIYKHLDCLSRFSFVSAALYDAKDYDILFDLRDTYLKLHALHQQWDISALEN